VINSHNIINITVLAYSLNHTITTNLTAVEIWIESNTFVGSNNSTFFVSITPSLQHTSPKNYQLASVSFNIQIENYTQTSDFVHPVSISFYPGFYDSAILEKKFCLASAKNDVNQTWECQDLNPTNQNGVITGKVYHFTSFSILVQNTNKNGAVFLPVNVGAVVFTVLFIVFIVVVIGAIVITFEMKKRKKKGVDLKKVGKRLDVIIELGTVDTMKSHENLGE